MCIFQFFKSIVSCYFIQISPKFDAKSLSDNESKLVQLMGLLADT